MLFLKNRYAQTLRAKGASLLETRLRDAEAFAPTGANLLNNFHTNETLINSEELFAASL